MRSAFLLTLLLLFVLCSGIIYYLDTLQVGFDFPALMVGNVLLAGISLLSVALVKRGVSSNNPNTFVRAKMSATMVKFFVCIIALLAYVFLNNRQLPHKPSLFLFVGMYLIYAIIESAHLSKIARK